MKQKKGRDYKSTGQWTDENRLEKNALEKNIEAAKTRGEFGEDKLVSQQPNDNNRRKRMKNLCFLAYLYYNVKNKYIKKRLQS